MPSRTSSAPLRRCASTGALPPSRCPPPAAASAAATSLAKYASPSTVLVLASFVMILTFLANVMSFTVQDIWRKASDSANQAACAAHLVQPGMRVSGL